jgi:hypothetical protein
MLEKARTGGASTVSPEDGVSNLWNSALARLPLGLATVLNGTKLVKMTTFPITVAST